MLCRELIQEKVKSPQNHPQLVSEDKGDNNECDEYDDQDDEHGGAGDAVDDDEDDDNDVKSPRNAPNWILNTWFKTTLGLKL